VFYVTSLRLLPLVPQWLVNLASPHAGVPLVPFALATGVGLAPYNAITVHAGAVLGSISGWDDVLTARVLLALVALAAMALAPPLVLRWRRARSPGGGGQHRPSVSGASAPTPMARGGAGGAGSDSVGTFGGVASRRRGSASAAPGQRQVLV
jgi:hypothetical protein